MNDPLSGLTYFLAELRRRRVFRVAAVYAVAGWVVIQGSSAILPTLEAPLWVGKVVLVLVGLGFVLAVALAWAFDVTPAGIVRTSDAEARSAADGELENPSAAPLRPSRLRSRSPVVLVAGGFVVLAVLGSYAFFRSRAARRDAPITSVAVLSFSNLSRDPENEYFGDGVADELLNQLAKVPGLNVAARTSSFYFKGRNLPLDEIARRLKVDAVMEGSVQRVGGRLRIQARLISARTGYQLWSDRYDREPRDLFAVQDEIARAVVSALRIQMTGTPGRRHVPDSAAYDLYLRGRFLYNRGSREDVERSIELFQQAIARDSEFAEPYVGAAAAWGNLADGYLAPLQAYPKTEALAQRALALDEGNAEAHAQLAACRMILHWDWAGAEREFRRALELNPKDAASHAIYAQYLTDRGDLRRALAEAREAVRLEPFTAWQANWLVGLWSLAGEADSAIAAYTRLQEVAPGYMYAGSTVSAAYRAKGRYAEALTLDQADRRATGVPAPGLVEDLVALGRRAEAEATLGEMIAQSKKRYVMPEGIALAALALGRREQALEWLERGVDAHSANAPTVARTLEVRPLLSDPRYQRLLQRMGLDTLRAESG